MTDPVLATDLAQLRDAVVAALKTKIPNVDIDTHGGTFDEAELKRYAAFAPAIRVAIVGCGKGYRWSDGRWAIPVQFAAVCIAGDTPSADRTKIVNRDTAALLLATAIELAVQGNRFGLSGVRQPENLMARNEYSGPVDKASVAIWQITWSSDALLGESVDESIAAILTLLAVEGDATPLAQATQIYPAPSDGGVP